MGTEAYRRPGYKFWVLTINNPGELDPYQVLYENKTLIDYMVVGKEGFPKDYRKPDFVPEGCKARTPHLQMAVCFTFPLSFKEIKEMFPRAFIERVKHQFTNAAQYCMKENNYKVYGSLKAAQALQNEIRESKRTEKARDDVFVPFPDSLPEDTKLPKPDAVLFQERYIAALTNELPHI